MGNFGPDQLDLAYSAMNVFLEDGKLDLQELNFVLGLALKDGVVDEVEKKMLRSIFDEAEERGVTPLVALRIKTARKKHGI